MSSPSRRDALRIGTALAAAACSSRGNNAESQPAPTTADASSPRPAIMNTRAIPRSGEQLPVIGLGTWQTFDVGGSAADRAPLVQVVQQVLAAGARVIDSSPMYGRAEQVTGDVLAQIGKLGTPFLATKVWTTGKQAGIDQMTRSMQRMRASRIDLMQVHNLQDVATHLPVLRDWKREGKLRYIGVTHYSHGAFGEIEQLMRREQLDFIQIPYSVVDRAVEQRILPAARETRTAVLVMTPFESGELFKRVAGKPLPSWAAELDCTSWAQLFLKFLLGHPAVNCPIPATSNPRHAADNLRAGLGRMPDEALRRKIVNAVEG
ncbi:MAG: aldo/keto reductase [Kofleriaceae bacterium]